MIKVAHNTSNKFLELIRWNEWSDSKLPFIFTGYLLIAIKHPTTNFDAAIFLRILGFCFFYLAFGYLFNDWMDQKSDQIAGKTKYIHNWKPWQSIGILITFSFISFLFLLPLIRNYIILIIMGLCYILAVTYSGTFLRFKERGWVGLLVASLAQRTLPVSLVFAALDVWDSTVFLFLILTILIGVRWMITHQIDDLKRDRATATKTFATMQQGENALFKLLSTIFNLEILNIIILAVIMKSQLLFLIICAYIGLTILLSFATCTTPWQMLKTPTTAYLVLADFYFLYWPLGMLSWFSIKQFDFWWLVTFLFVFLIYKHILQQLSTLYQLSNNLMKGTL